MIVIDSHVKLGRSKEFDISRDVISRAKNSDEEARFY
jgi:hypothetical protein